MTDRDRAWDAPPTARYKLTLTITGNTLDEIEGELLAQVGGGFMLDSGGYRRDEWEVVGGRRTSRMERVNPEQTPENYARELGEWMKRQREERGR